MSDSEKSLYPDLPQRETKEAKGETADLSNERVGNILYPPQDGRFPITPDGSRPNSCIRDIDGLIIEQAPAHNKPEDMAAARNNRLNRADLEGMDFKGKTMAGSKMKGASLKGTSFEGGSLHDSNLAGANLEGANLKNCDMRMTDLRGASFSAETDISGADFSDGWIDEQTLHRLSQVKGFHQARNLKVRSDA